MERPDGVREALGREPRGFTAFCETVPGVRRP